MQIDASAPTRIDLAGGTLDIWPLYLFHEGAQTLNAAISLRARCTILPRQDCRIVIVWWWVPVLHRRSVGYPGDSARARSGGRPGSGLPGRARRSADRDARHGGRALN